MFVSGLFIWLMAWRSVPETWRRKQGIGFPAALYSGLAVVAGLVTAFIEFAWYGLATRVDPWRVLAANESIDRGLRPAHWVVVTAATIAVLFVVRRLTRGRQPVRRVAA